MVVSMHRYFASDFGALVFTCGGQHRSLLDLHSAGAACDSRFYGDPALIRLAEASGGLPRSGVVPKPDGFSTFSRVTAIAAMLAALLVGFRTEKVEVSN